MSSFFAIYTDGEAPRADVSVPRGVELSLIIYDLGGITEYSGVDVFPALPIADPVAVNHLCYSPAKWDSYAWWVDEPCAIGFENIRAELRASGQSPYRLWATAIAAHPLAYAEHRLRHFNSDIHFLVPGEAVRPVPEQSDPNPWQYRVRPNVVRDIIDRIAIWSSRTLAPTPRSFPMSARTLGSTVAPTWAPTPRVLAWAPRASATS